MVFFFNHSISVTHYSLLITHYSLLITHHSLLIALNTHRTYWKKQKKKHRTDRTSEKNKKKNKNRPKWKKEEEEEKKKKRTEQPTKRGKEKKSKVVKSCGWVLFVSPLCVFNYNIAIELWVMETENNQNVFLVSITHNSKIRELNDGNIIIICQTTFLSWVSPFLSYELWKQRIKLRKQLNQTASKRSNALIR